MKKSLCAIGFYLTSCVVLLFAQDTPTITVSKSDRINLNVTPLSGG